MMKFLVFFIVILSLTDRVHVVSVARTKLATFNTALVPLFSSVNGSPQVEERATRLIKEIRESDVDIFCLQEVLLADVQRHIYRAVKDKYPYVHTATDLTAHDSDTTPACTPEESITLLSCISTQCLDVKGLSLLVCSSRCLAEVTSQPCRDCMSLLGPKLTTPSLCSSVVPASRFETNYGLMLLSRKKLENVGVSGFNKYSQFRGYLDASVEGVGDLVCAHLSAPFPVYVGPPVISPPLYSNYDEQQHDELLTLFELAAAKHTPILMGDFNNGPAYPSNNNTGQLPSHYNLLQVKGFASPYVLEDGRCTFCSSNNPSVSLSGFESDVTIDHIYLATEKLDRVISSKRFLDDVHLESGNPLSDHYGVMLTLEDIP